MANFKTHLAVGTTVSGLLATAAFSAGFVTADKIFPLAAAGAIGSLLPDIDLKNSNPSKLLFATLGLILAFMALLNTAGTYSLIEMWLLWIGIYLSTRYIVWKVFHDYTVHRGIFHSVLAALFFCFLTASLYYRFSEHHSAYAWLMGGFVFIGYITHLILDEVYSVDFEGARLKRSFGTALKLYSYNNPKTSLLFLAATVLAWFMAPSAETVQQLLSNGNAWQQLVNNIVPQGRWFQ